MESMKTPCALTIAGSDSGGGAGIQADLKTFAALGVHGACALTAVTAQNTEAVAMIVDLPVEMVKAQIKTILEDMGVDAAKTGMLHTSEIVRAVAEEVEEHGLRNLVVDPVMKAKGGVLLLKDEAVEVLKKKLIPLATVLTPNAVEAEAIAGVRVETEADAEKAALKIWEKFGVKAVVVKGGHLRAGARAVDILCLDGKCSRLEAERIESKTTHGTGCVFSAAIAAELAKGASIPDAVKAAKQFVYRSILFGLPIGRAAGPVNPMAQLFHEAEKYQVIRKVREAVSELERHPSVAKLIPESSSNLVMAPDYALSPEEFVGIPGRIVKIQHGVKAVSEPDLGASRHVAGSVYVAMSCDSSVRAGMNIRYSEEILARCRKLGFTVSGYDRREEPREVKEREGASTPWGAEKAIKRVGFVPDVIYHMGDWGKEPMITVLGKSALEVVGKVVKIAED